jgi:hypothetical protein
MFGRGGKHVLHVVGMYFIVSSVALFLAFARASPRVWVLGQWMSARIVGRSWRHTTGNRFGSMSSCTYSKGRDQECVRAKQSS